MISIISAFDRNQIISINGKMPWNLPKDLLWFKKMTIGKPVIMGRKTYESIGHSLTGRRNIILSLNKNLQIPGCEVYTSIELALNAVKNSPEVMVIGGASIYEKFLPIAHKLYLTFIDCDSLKNFKDEILEIKKFPDWNKKEWQEIKRIDCKTDYKNPYFYSFVSLVRK